MSPDSAQSANDLEQAVFQAVYRSAVQKRRRMLATVLIFTGQILRTLLLVWPMGVLLLISLLAPESAYKGYILLVLAPGLIVWGVMLVRGTSKDFHNRVRGNLLENKDLAQFLLPPRRWEEI